MNENLTIIERARATSYKTPYFYTLPEILNQNYSAFCNLFTDTGIYYAVKANSDPHVVQYLNSLGCGFEAASVFEIEQLLELGVQPDKIIYGTAIKPAEHIARARAIGVDCFAADSDEEIEKLAEHAPGAKVYVRAIVDDAGSVYKMSERFGAPVSAVERLLLRVRERQLRPHGISFYVGSQAATADKWAKGIDTVRPVVDGLQRRGIRLEILNIGGGFPVAYANHANCPALSEIARSTHEALARLPYQPKLVMEPGRGIVGNSSVLVSTVISRCTRGDRSWLCLDAGIYNALFEAMVHQGGMVYNVHPFRHPAARDMVSYTLTGPTGDSLDIIAKDVRLPGDILVGDKLIFESVGAYSVTMGSRFNGFPPVPVHIG
jgi:ornithine decarboxylase